MCLVNIFKGIGRFIVRAVLCALLAQFAQKPIQYKKNIFI